MLNAGHDLGQTHLPKVLDDFSRDTVHLNSIFVSVLLACHSYGKVDSTVALSQNLQCSDKTYKLTFASV